MMTRDAFWSRWNPEAKRMMRRSMHATTPKTRAIHHEIAWNAELSAICWWSDAGTLIAAWEVYSFAEGRYGGIAEVEANVPALKRWHRDREASSEGVFTWSPCDPEELRRARA